MGGLLRIRPGLVTETSARAHEFQLSGWDQGCRDPGMIELTGVQAAPANYIVACAMLTFISTFAVARLDSRRNVIAVKIA